MKFTCVIPARAKSSRFPDKPLALINGKPMILWIIENANKSKFIKKAIVATDDSRIFDLVNMAGYEAVYTSPECPNGTERVAEVASRVSDEYIFEMQGDQPLVTADVIDNFITDAVAAIESDSGIDVVIPFAEATEEQTASPDVLKVVVSSNNRLLFQTRHPIKTNFRTLGLYLWKNESLQRFAQLPVSNIEKAEDSHPIRLYVNDFCVKGVKNEDSNWVEVDRPEQIQRVEEIMKQRGL